MSATATEAANGAKTLVGKVIPAMLQVIVNGITITAPVKPGKTSGKPWFEAAQQGTLKAGVSIEDALLRAAVSFEGEALLPTSKYVTEQGVVLGLTEPQKYRKGHAKEGQTIPNTGGDQIISFGKMLPEWGENGYYLRVTLKAVERASGIVIKVTVSCTPRPAPREARIVGSADGEISFG